MEGKPESLSLVNYYFTTMLESRMGVIGVKTSSPVEKSVVRDLDICPRLSQGTESPHLHTNKGNRQKVKKSTGVANQPIKNANRISVPALLAGISRLQ